MAWLDRLVNATYMYMHIRFNKEGFKMGGVNQLVDLASFTGSIPFAPMEESDTGEDY